MIDVDARVDDSYDHFFTLHGKRCAPDLVRPNLRHAHLELRPLLPFAFDKNHIVECRDLFDVLKLRGADRDISYDSLNRESLPFNRFQIAGELHKHADASARRLSDVMR